ncbi:MAG: APC family permease [Acidobacteriia bacterium]|nr:APC family permease [Terriglobia bacterium]
MEQGKTTLVRTIGRWSLVGLMINLVIGSGIFGLPSQVAALTGRQSPLVFVFAAAGIAVIAGCIAELASRFAESGGPYLYTRLAFGRFVGIQTGWVNWLSRVAATAAGANLFTVYLAEFWPALEHRIAAVFTMSVLLALLTAFNVRGVKVGAGMNNVLAVSKLVPLLTFILVGCIFLSTSGSPVARVQEQHPANAWLNAILLVIFAYVGFESAMIPAGEAKSPERDAPIAILIAFAAVTPIYVLVQFVTVQTLSNPAQTQRPLAAAAHIFGGAPLVALIGLGALLSVLGYLAACMIAGPRILFALAEQKDFPRYFAAVHPRYRTPFVSILFFATLVWILALMGNFAWNARLTAISRLVTYALSCAALPTLRRKSTKQPRFHLPAGDLLAVIGIVFCGALVSRIGKAEILILLLTLVFGSLNWLIVSRHSKQGNAEASSVTTPPKTTAA